jgi:hypothetical protein
VSLREYFTLLIERVEASDITNQGKDENGFYKPTRKIILNHLTILRDLHDKPRAKEMIKASRRAIAQELPYEWLVLDVQQKNELAKILNEESS